MADFILEGTAENFSELVLENSRKGLVLVDFWAPWAGPCQRQREILTRLANRHGGRFLLVTVNTDRQKPLSEEYGVRSLPSLRAFRFGRVVDRFHGMQTEADYETLVDAHLGAGGSKVQQQAARAWREGRQEEALQMLAEAAVNDPDDLALPHLMARFLMQQERYQDAAQLLEALPADARDTEEIATLRAHIAFIQAADRAPDAALLEARIGEDPDDKDARWQLAARHLVGDDFEAALRQLIEILRRDRGYRDYLAQRGILAVFNLMEGQEELVKKYRAELFRLIH
ncbi:MAG: tetratricopeptide repeat protein [Pseudomonadota bacterium]